MVEKLKDLNLKCQKADYKTKGNWMVRNILRDMALPITWLLLHTKITANQVTLIALVIGIMGATYLSASSSSAFLFAVILLQLWYLLDHVDGQVARYHGQANISGRYFDFLMHHIIHGIIPFFMGIYICNLQHWNGWVALGFVASVCTFIFNMIYDIRAKAILEIFDSKNTVNVISNDQENDKPQGEEKKIFSPRRLFSLFHKSFEIHVLINSLLLSSLVEYFLHFNTRFVLYIYYMLMACFLCLFKNYYMIHDRKVDSYIQSKYEIH